MVPRDTDLFVFAYFMIEMCAFPERFQVFFNGMMEIAKPGCVPSCVRTPCVRVFICVRTFERTCVFSTALRGAKGTRTTADLRAPASWIPPQAPDLPRTRQDSPRIRHFRLPRAAAVLLGNRRWG